jgi:O-Antigen ligase
MNRSEPITDQPYSVESRFISVTSYELTWSTGWPSRAALGEVAAGLIAFAGVAGLAADNGGYSATTGGWSSVALCAIAAVFVALSGVPRLGAVEAIVLAAMVALSAWTFASAIWSVSVTRSPLEGERSLVYVSGLTVALLLSRRAGGRAIVIGTWLAITAVSTYALLTRVFPEQFGVYDQVSGNRLSSPLGYWNALGLFAAIGCVLALGLAARAVVWVRMAAAASTVVLVLTLYFTFGRGAWVALFVGVLAAVVFDRRRLQFVVTTLVVAAWPAIAVCYASRAHALTRVDVPISAAQKDGHAVAVISVIVLTIAALSMLVLETLEGRSRLTRSRALRWAFVALVACGLAVSISVVLHRYGSPVRIARDAWHSFVTPLPVKAPNLNARLFTLSANGRIDHWRVAVHEFERHPLLGSGAGTYGEYWFQLRPSAFIAHDAHSVYLETLAELGPIGLALLVLVLGGLVVAAARSASPLAPAAVGALAAYALHAAADWDWEVPALLLAAMLPALAVAGAEASRSGRRLWHRGAAVGVVLLVGGLALFTLLGNIALARSSNASDSTDWRHAASEARSAMTLAPWSAEPWRELAVAQVGLGEIGSARSSLVHAVKIEPRDWSLWYQLSEVSTGALHRRALAQVDRLNPKLKLTGGEATPGDLRLVVIP